MLQFLGTILFVSDGPAKKSLKLSNITGTYPISVYNQKFIEKSASATARHHSLFELCQFLFPRCSMTIFIISHNISNNNEQNINRRFFF